MIETVTALLLFLNGNMIEHVYKPDLGACLEDQSVSRLVGIKSRTRGF